MENVRDILNDFLNGVNTIAQEEDATVQAFMNLQNAAFAPSALDVKTKEAHQRGHRRLQPLQVLHRGTRVQRMAGATRQEIFGCRYGRRRRLRRWPQHGLLFHLSAGSRERVSTTSTSKIFK